MSRHAPKIILDLKILNELWLSSGFHVFICHDACAAGSPMSAVDGVMPFAVMMAAMNESMAIPKKARTHFLLFSLNRRAVDFIPAMASSSLSWWAYMVS